VEKHNGLNIDNEIIFVNKKKPPPRRGLKRREPKMELMKIKKVRKQSNDTAKKIGVNKKMYPRHR
jgi:hypothetical protein